MVRGEKCTKRGRWNVFLRSMYQGYFINLDRSIARRKSFEEMVARVGASERYQRFPAVDGRAVSPGIPTKLRPGEVGCYMSHLNALKQPHAGHVHIVEDDAEFAPGIVDMIDQTIARVTDATKNQWDMIFTEVIVSYDTHTFQKLFASYSEFQRDGTVSLIAMKDIHYWGMSSYIVNAKSIAKVAAILESGGPNALPEDHLRVEIRAGRLNAIVVVPFLTSVSAHNDVSEIIAPENDAITQVVSQFRRAFYIHADHSALLAEVKRLSRDTHVPPLTELYAQIMRFVFSNASKPGATTHG
jgi:GR25 family glycosyltransferase involved in LPS biosynthesis